MHHRSTISERPQTTTFKPLFVRVVNQQLQRITLDIMPSLIRIDDMPVTDLVSRKQKVDRTKRWPDAIRRNSRMEAPVMAAFHMRLQLKRGNQSRRAWVDGHRSQSVAASGCGLTSQRTANMPNS